MTQGPIETVAARLAMLRKEQGMSGEDVAASMREHGIPWKRDVVANLEGGRRARLDVDELLALALVLKVPPVMLLVDPSSQRTPITPAADAPTFAVLRWLLADAPVDVPLDKLSVRDASWNAAQTSIRLTRALHTALLLCSSARRSLAAARRQDDPERVERAGARLRDELLHLSEVLAQVAEEGLPAPLLPDADGLDAAAAEQGVVLGVTRDPLGLADEQDGS